VRNLWTLYRYEIRKLTGRKLLWVTALLCAAGVAISAFAGIIGTYYVDGKPIESNYEAFRKDQAYRKAISGRAIDEMLLRETVDGYRHVPADAGRYTLTEEYETYARPYSDIFNLIRAWTGMDLSSIQSWEPDEAELYEARMQMIERSWQSALLTQKEKAYWREMEGRINKPFVYRYHEGYEMILNCFLTVGVMLLVFVAVCLPNLFADEHTQRTDQLVLSCPQGRMPAYWAKMLAGVTVCVAAAILMTLLIMGLCLLFYGTEGFDMPFQAYNSGYSYPISIGQACLIAYGMLIAASVLAAVFVMVTSELFRSGIAALSISTALIILGNVVMIPAQYRVLAQIWDWSPMAYLSAWNVFDSRTLVLFGRCFPSWQVVPGIYLLLSGALSFAGARIYRQYQVTGR